MSFAACEERCARLRTSDATTAKPRPASPARAASTAALSASRLVCRAISSITLMMSEIFRDDSSISDIALTACATTAPPRSATVAVSLADWFACAAFSAFFFTVTDICSIEAEVCFQARRLFLRALRQVGRRGGNLRRRVRDLARGRLDVAKDVRHRVQEPVDPLAQPADVAALALERNALRQVVVLDRAHDVLRLLHGRSTVAVTSVGVFDDLERLAVGVEDRIVARLNPDFLAALADPLVLIGIELAAPELGPELAILRALRVGGSTNML